MAFVSVHDFNDENNNKYIDFLNKELCFSIEKNSKEAILFLEAITTPAFSKKYNESNNVKNKIKNYDVNEFKGDAIITYIVVTEILNDEPVVRMHDKKTKLIENKHFIKMFNSLGLERFIFVDNVKDIGDKIKADVIESLAYAMHESSIKNLTTFLKKHLVKDEIIDHIKK